MISAVDSSVLLDVLAGSDEKQADASEALLRRAGGEGRLIICECVVAEVLPALGTTARLREFAHDWRLDFIACDFEDALLAGDCFAMHLKRGGRRGRVLPDFLIGAHALRHADRLLARDRGYLRDYFRGLKVLAV